jgi:predicted  nucleic acid-binding Zn-ribbon protein
MAELIDTVRDLLRLNSIDLRRHALQVELETTPSVLKALDVELSSRTAERERLQAEFKAARSALGAAEVDLSKAEKRRVRAQERIPLLQTAEQVEATEREVIALAEFVDTQESEILERMDSVEGLDVATVEAEQSAEAGGAELITATEAWTERRPVLDTEMAELDGQRVPIAESLRSDIRRRYQLAWRQRGKIHPSGLTQVVGRICVTCHTEISARWLQECKEHEALHSCQGCKRLLLFDPDAPPPGLSAATEDDHLSA